MLNSTIIGNASESLYQVISNNLSTNSTTYPAGNELGGQSQGELALEVIANASVLILLGAVVACSIKLCCDNENEQGPRATGNNRTENIEMVQINANAGGSAPTLATNINEGVVTEEVTGVQLS